MADRDLQDLLPPTPPPRPDRREAAIGAALRHFDGKTEPSPALPARRRRLLAAPQLGALAAAALVAAVGLPLWLAGERPPPAAVRAPVLRDAPEVVADVVPAPAPEAARLAAEAPAAPPQAAAVEPVPVPPASAPDAVASTSIAPATDRPAPVASLRAPVARSPAPVEVAAAAPPPPAAPSTAAEDAAADIVVTGSRVSARNIAQRRSRAMLGDWNRCTIDDPRQDAAACRPRHRAGTPSPARQAEQLVADGIAAAWRGDDASALTALDQAIGVAPRSTAAWLNRGMVRARNGDSAAALVDLDQAVKLSPRDARVRYQRSLALDDAGKPTRAEADAARAIELDERYGAVLN